MGYREFLKKSGRRDSNPRHSAWEADILPLNYARKKAHIFFCNKSIRFLCFLSIHLFWPNCAGVPGKLFFASSLYSGSDDPPETYLCYSVSPLVRLGTPYGGDALRRSPQDRQLQARKHGGAGRYKWRKIAMSLPPRIPASRCGVNSVRGVNPILLCEVARYVARVSLVSMLLRLRPELLIKL